VDIKMRMQMPHPLRLAVCRDFPVDATRRGDWAKCEKRGFLRMEGLCYDYDHIHLPQNISFLIRLYSLQLPFHGQPLIDGTQFGLV
jgi:hypothetical protein